MTQGFGVRPHTEIHVATQSWTPEGPPPTGALQGQAAGCVLGVDALSTVCLERSKQRKGDVIRTPREEETRSRHPLRARYVDPSCSEAGGTGSEELEIRLKARTDEVYRCLRTGCLLQLSLRRLQ